MTFNVLDEGRFRWFPLRWLRTPTFDNAKHGYFFLVKIIAQNLDGGQLLLIVAAQFGMLRLT